MARDGGAPATAEAVEQRAEETPVAVAELPLEPEQLQSRLREKEQLVAALTDRLEQAAEQLDRLRRTGVDKGRRPAAGGFPIEVLEDHKQTLEDLKRVITRWEDMQAEVTLGRIETQIGELRDLVASGGMAASHPAAAAPPRERRAEPAAAPKPAGKPGGNAWWEAQKAALMGDQPAPEASPASQPQAAQAPADSAPAAAAPPDESAPKTGAPFDLAAFQIPELPPALDFENLSLDDARQAIRDRDKLIQQLREPLLVMQAAGQLPADIQSLAGIPEPLKERIAELEAQWQAKFRQVELDLSLERARLAREQASVRQQQELLQKQLRKGGSGGAAKQTADEPGKADEHASRRRWFRFMGKGEGEAEGEGAGKNAAQ